MNISKSIQGSTAIKLDQEKGYDRLRMEFYSTDFAFLQLSLGLNEPRHGERFLSSS